MHAEALAVAEIIETHHLSQVPQPDHGAHDLYRAMREVFCLPIKGLTPAEVIENRLVDMSIEALTQAIEAGQFCVEWDPERRCRELPVWQFLEPARRLMPPVLALLRENRFDTSDFWSDHGDDLLDLTPAEVLCGKLFITRQWVDLDQASYLAEPDARRQQIVMDHYKYEVAERTGVSV